MKRVTLALSAGAVSYAVTVAAGTAAGLDGPLVLMAAVIAGVAWTEWLL